MALVLEPNDRQKPRGPHGSYQRQLERKRIHTKFNDQGKRNFRKSGKAVPSLLTP